MLGKIEKLFQEYNAFNSRELKDAADGLVDHFSCGGKIMVTIAGALSTAGIGKTLVPLIKSGHINSISSTAANLEEDIFRIFSKNEVLENWREIKKEEELSWYKNDKLRVTDTLLDGSDFHDLASYFVEEVMALDGPELPHVILWRTIERLIKENKIDKNRLEEESWVYNCYLQGTPIFVPGWEDSTFANYCVAIHMRGNSSLNLANIKSGLEYMKDLALFYLSHSMSSPMGFVQLGGGIAGDFSICVVPLLTVMKLKEAPKWSYFCQVSESITSFGSYSGAPPNEKITWGKLDGDSKCYMIESDATIVAPLLFSYVGEVGLKR